jgi:DNA-binding MarR family transcriptional regulator
MLSKDIQFLELDRKNHILYQSCVFHMLAREELHPSQLPILWTLSRTGPSSQGQIARLLGVSRAAVAVSAKRMERSGLVHREKGPGDQRRNLVSLTQKGEAVARRAQELQQKILDRRLQGFTQEELGRMMEFYDRMNHNLESYREELESTLPGCADEDMGNEEESAC